MRLIAAAAALILCFSTAQARTTWPFGSPGGYSNYACAKASTRSPAGAPILDQTGSGFTHNLTSVTVNISAAYAGDILVAFYVSNLNGSTAFFDAVGLTWTQRKAVQIGSGTSGVRIEEWWAYSPNCLTNDPVTVQVGPTTQCMDLLVGSFNGVASSATPFDPNASLVANASGTSSAPGSVSYQTTKTADLLLTALAVQDGGASTPPTGFSAAVNITCGGNAPQARVDLASKSVLTPQNTSLTWTDSSTPNSWVEFVDALVGNGGGAGGFSSSLTLIGAGQ